MKLSVPAQLLEHLRPGALALRTARAARQGEKCHQPEQGRCGRVPDEQPEIAAIGEKTRRRRPERPSGVEAHAIGGECGDAPARGDEVGQERTARRTVEFPGQAGDRGQGDNGRQPARLGQQQHGDSREKH